MRVVRVVVSLGVELGRERERKFSRVLTYTSLLSTSVF